MADRRLIFAVGLVRLVVESEASAPDLASGLIERAAQDIREEGLRQTSIEWRSQSHPVIPRERIECRVIELGNDTVQINGKEGDRDVTRLFQTGEGIKSWGRSDLAITHQDIVRDILRILRKGIRYT